MARLDAVLGALLLFAGLTPIEGTLQAQRPLHSGPSQSDEHRGASTIRLNFSSSAPHLFHSTFSLLQQLPNTVFPNGHAIAALQIPAFTLLYHARRDADAPDSPEWVAFDSDMSYGIMGGHRNVWMQTYQTTRSVNALYFDGESGNLQGLGQFDTQMLLLYGNVTGPEGSDDLELEYARAKGLCDWIAEADLGGPGWGFEGVVRMNAGFEMIWCDFSSESIKLISKINVTAPQLPKPEENRNLEPVELGDGEPNLPPMPPNWRDELRREPFLRTRSWGWFDSATWHYGSSGIGFNVGETRATVLSCGILSFYSSQFANQSLNRAVEERESLNLTDSGLWKGPGKGGNRTIALQDLGRRRRFHHLEHATRAEADLMRTNTVNAMRRILDGKQCSGANWMLMASEVVQRTSKLLKNFESALYNSPDIWNNQTQAREWLHGVRGLSHLFLVNYLQYPSGNDSSVWETHSTLFNETYSMCRHRYTRLFDDSSLVPEEAEQRWALEETFGTICLVQIAVGFNIEQTWREAFGTNSSGVSSQEPDLGRQSRTWGDQVSELLAWLGWETEYIACKEVCAVDERCFIPMWPITRPELSPENVDEAELEGGYGVPHHYLSRSRSRRSLRTARRPWRHTDETDLWEPKCVKEVCIEGLCWI